MSVERCPNCDAVGVECGCAPQARFDPLRIRPYVTLPDPGQGDGPPPSQPVRGATPGRADTPAYGIPPVPPTHPAWPDETVPLRAVPPTPEPEGPRGAPASRRRRPLLPLLLGAAAVVALGSGAAALAMGAFGDSGESDAALSDPKPSAPVVSVATAAPSKASTGPTRSPSASASPTRSASPSPSPSASRSASPSPSASASRSSAPPSPSASASRAPSSQAPKPAQSLQYGDAGAEVERLQRLLASAHLYRGKFTGKYDDRTENAVSEFQWRHEIFDDPWGVYGPATRKALEG
ncbi:peptidoglycan-binding protein [Streptomyces goshikiensis]|uniref:peptidoglycan-binding domain-containing protein n=1 Tax=Streptomyces goshikiensis TaxID=1942 RepID=UPI00367DD4CE